MPQAKKAVARALEIDPDLAEAHTAYGLILGAYEWDWAGADREFKRSLELDPKIALAHFRYAWVDLSPRGRHEEAIAEMKRAMELDPLSLIQGANFAAVYMYARQYDNAVEQATKTYDLDHSFFAAQNWLAHSYNAKGMHKEAIAIAEKSLGSDFEMFPQLGYAYAKLGQRQQSEDVLKQWLAKDKYISNYWVAIVYTAMGDKDKAFEQLEKAYKAHDWFMERVKTDPFLDPLRDDPRMNDLLKRVGL
jgi:tetratricopeptide (TPR) repeat protein